MENFLKDDELEIWEAFLDGKVILNYKPVEDDRYTLFCYQGKVYHYDCSGPQYLDLKTDKSYIERLALIVISDVLSGTEVVNINLENIKNKCKDGYLLYLDWDYYYVTDRNIFNIDSSNEVSKTDINDLIFQILYHNTQGSSIGFNKI